MTQALSRHDRVLGSLIGGAVGDALGYQVEFDAWPFIAAEFGPAGVTEMRFNRVSDDTQMTLFTAEGLLLAAPGGEVESVRKAYLRWLNTQREPMPPMASEGLAAQPWLYARRAPGNACISGLAAHDRVGDASDWRARTAGVNANSKGCGTVMRSAPFGLRHSPAAAYDLAEQCSALTHGHPTAGTAAGAFAMIVSHLVNGETPQRAVSETMLHLRRDLGRSETADALQRAYMHAGTVPPGPNTCAKLGEGWIAEEALAIAVYCFLGTDDVRAGLVAAVSHGGDSDSTGSVLGNLYGAAYGHAALPREWSSQVEGREVIAALAGLLSAEPVSESAV
ncbi:ADP-ribosylglycohydrolase family protein [Glycomyces scopariae]|uniref:ADP-ribosylglycohydrolase n=1 Tax=Glycomyces sambucus TaxID=380244 RepID=A0A1G9IJY5_9ACTN|nr:ADP-ribosylglycohydrolase family protein [Glycomyces sambucus]SDL25164.1 ADP-ribosylglycohydrolase [Glycomyces sambucus]